MAARTAAMPLQHVLDRTLTADTALKIAWRTWITFLIIPFLVFISAMWYLMSDDHRPADLASAQRWFIASMALLAISVPGAFFIRGRMFKGYWSGQIVAPRDYLIGMNTIWGSLEISGLFALAGCFVTGTLLPTLLPAMLAFMLFTPLWPNGHSMSRPLVNEHDPADYEDPR